MGKAPNFIRKPIQRHPEKIFIEEYEKLRETINRAIESGGLAVITAAHPYRIDPFTFIQWAKSIEILVPKALAERVKQYSNRKDVDWQEKYEAQTKTVEDLTTKLKKTDQECKKLKNDKAALQKKLNNSDATLTAFVNSKHSKNPSKVRMIQDACQREGWSIDDEPIRERLNHGKDVIDNKTKRIS